MRPSVLAPCYNIIHAKTITLQRDLHVSERRDIHFNIQAPI